MGFAAAADEERVLSFSTQEAGAPPPPPGASASSSRGTPPSGVVPTDPAAVAPPPGGVAAHTNRVLGYARQTWDERRPWREFYSTRTLSVPRFADLSDRFAANLHVYRANYQIIAAAWLVLLLLGSLQSLLLGALGFFGIERITARKAEKNGGVLPHKFKVIAAFGGLGVVWLSGLGDYVVRWAVATALTVSAHASFHEPQTDETEIATV